MIFITALIVGERGQKLSEEVVLPYKVFPQIDDQRFMLLKFVDPYGHTVFNLPQIPVILADLKLLRESKSEEQEHELIDQLIVFANKCAAAPHSHYLKFIGD